LTRLFRIGIDLGGTKIEGVLLGDEPTRPLHRLRVPTPRGRGYEAILAEIVGIARELESHASGDGIVRIGIGIPGTISATHGRVKNANTTELNGRPLQTDLEERLGRAVLCENDANCFALAETLHGAGRGKRCVFGVILGTGVGGGIVMDGRIWQGAQGIAGEWGHMLLDPSGPPCYCGRRGCVETILSGPGLVRSYETLGGAPRTAAEIWARAKGEGDDPPARRAVEEYQARFGEALAQVINVLDPNVIVLGGGVSNSPGLAEGAPERIRPHVFNDETLTIVRRHELGDSAGVLGAAWLGGGTEGPHPIPSVRFPSVPEEE
jgi:fructokinase